METIYLIIAGMAIATYLPRMLPAVLMEHIHVQKRAEKFLKVIPFAAIGTLIFPGILSVDINHPYVGIIGGGVAAFLSYKKKNMTIIIIASIVTVAIINHFV